MMRRALAAILQELEMWVRQVLNGGIANKKAPLEGRPEQRVRVAYLWSSLRFSLRLSHA